jgi:putative addiction module killer protein
MIIINNDLEQRYRKTDVFNSWIKELPHNVQVKVWIYINRFLRGNNSNCKAVGEGVSEIKINYQKGYRIYYTISKNRKPLLLAGSDKDGNQKQQNETIQKAIYIKKYFKVRGIL